MDEVHIPNAELRSSAELLSEPQKAEGGESCMTQPKTSIQETGAAHVSSQTASRKFARTRSAFLPAERPFSHKEPFLRPKGENYSCQLFVWRSSVNSGLQNGYKKWCVVTTKMNDNLTQHQTGTREGRYCCKRTQNMEHKISQRSIGFDLSMKGAARQETNTARIPKIPWLTFEQFKDTLIA